MVQATGNIDNAIIKARAQLILRQPFYGALALRLIIVETYDLPTMATDQKHLFYNPNFLHKECPSCKRLHTQEEILGVVAHEVEHCAKKHCFRLKGRHPFIWNKSCDWQINPNLIKAGFVLPPCALMRVEYTDLGAEDIYRIEMDKERKKEEEKRKTQPKQQQDQPEDDDDDSTNGRGDDEDDSDDSDSEDEESDEGDSDDASSDDSSDEDGEETQGGDSDGDDTGGDSDQGTSGEGEDDDSNSLGENDDEKEEEVDWGGVLPVPGDEEEVKELETAWDVSVRQAVNVAIKAAGGNIPDFLADLVKELRHATTDWCAVIRNFFEPTDRNEYSYRRPNRKFTGQDYVLPGLFKDRVNHMIVAIDASGSTCAPGIQNKFMGEAQTALDDGNVDQLTFLFCDASVYDIKEYQQGDVIEPFKIRGGGTLFSPVFDWILENAQDAQGVIYFTDMLPNERWDTMTDPEIPVLWAGYGNPKELRPQFARIPFGEYIELTDDK